MFRTLEDEEKAFLKRLATEGRLASEPSVLEAIDANTLTVCFQEQKLHPAPITRRHEERGWPDFSVAIVKVGRGDVRIGVVKRCAKDKHDPERGHLLALRRALINPPIDMLS